MYKALLCLRYATTRPIGLVSVVSVMLGVGTLIVVNSVMGGFRDRMRDRLHGVLSDVMVSSRGINGFAGYDEVMADISAAVGGKLASMTPVIETPGFFLVNMPDGRQESMPGVIVGIEPQGRAAVGDFAQHLQNPANRANPSFTIFDDAIQYRKDQPEVFEQALPDPRPEAGENYRMPAIVGHQIGTRRELGPDGLLHDVPFLPPGAELTIMAAEQKTNRGKPEAAFANCIVTDWFKCDMSEYDAHYVFVPLDHLQKRLSPRLGEKRVTSIQLKLKDYADAPLVVRTLSQRLNLNIFHVMTWEDRQATVLQAVKVEAFLLNFILFFIIAVAGFGILAVFFMIVVEKTRDIGVLKALGASDGGVMKIFVGYGTALGVVGCLLGAALGVWFTLNINAIERWLTARTGIEIFPRDIYYFKDIPARLDAGTVLWVNAGALFIAIAAAVLPAWRAARLKPVEALRYE